MGTSRPTGIRDAEIRPAGKAALDVDQLTQLWASGGIVDVGPHPALGNQPGFSQDGELLRQIRLACSEARIQVADAGFLLGQDPQDLEPNGVAKRLEQLGLAQGQPAARHVRLPHVQSRGTESPRVGIPHVLGVRCGIWMPSGDGARASGERQGPGDRGLRLGVEDSNLGIRIQSPLSYH